jgi:hypothetical protein
LTYEEPSSASLSAASSLSGTAPLPVGKVLVLFAVIAMAAFVALKWDAAVKPLLDRVTSGRMGEGQPIFITAESNLPGHVIAVHSEKGAPEQQTPLGDLPLKHAPGAHVGDTIIIENKTLGARYKQNIEFGEPGEVKVIRHEFKTGNVLPKLKNAPAKGLQFFLENQFIAEYSPNLTFGMVEGDYILEVRGDALQKPISFRLRVKGDQTNSTPLIDVRPYLRKGAAQDPGQ